MVNGKEFAQFVSISKGSLSELETQVSIAVDLGYLTAEHEIHSCLERLAKLLAGLHKSIVS